MNRFTKAWRALTSPRRRDTITEFCDKDGVGRTMLSWLISGISADAEIYKNLRVARAKCRALDTGSEPNDYVRKFLAELENNVFGSEGVVLQMKILETTDRVVYAADEKQFIEDYESRTIERRARVVRRLRKRFPTAEIANPEPEKVIHMRAGNATVLRGQPDVYANNLIEAAWAEWCKKINCTVTRQLDFQEIERVNLRGVARDGEAILRKVRGFKNDFGFALQLIDPEWLDINVNGRQQNGNMAIMGVEFNEWREPVAFHIITQRPEQWLYSTVNSFGSSSSGLNRERVAADEIIHVFAHERVDQSRGVPWLISVINRLRMLGKYEEAELIASMASACKTGNYYNDMDPSAEFPGEIDTRTGEFIDRMVPGGISINRFGWKFQQNNPTHPNGNYSEFRKGVLRGVAAGLPGSTYYGISQDLEAVNFSSMQGGDREAREAYMMIQNWFIANFHNRIFPEFLEAGLMSGSIALPISKFDKFNKATWHGRRWKAIDPIKQVTSQVLAIENGLTSRQRVIAEMSGDDYEEIMIELAYEDSFEDALGLEFTGATKLSQVEDQSSQEAAAQDAAAQAAQEKNIASLAGRLLGKQKKNGAHRN